MIYKLGVEPLIDAMAVYRAKSAKESPSEQFKQIETLVKELLDINAPLKTVKNGMTYLMVAVSQCKTEIIELLLKHGADPNVGNAQGMRPLATALLKKHPEQKHILKLLLEYGADPALGDKPGQAALDVAKLCQVEPALLSLLEEANNKLHWAQSGADEAPADV